MICIYNHIFFLNRHEGGKVKLKHAGEYTVKTFICYCMCIELELIKIIFIAWVMYSIKFARNKWPRCNLVFILSVNTSKAALMLGNKYWNWLLLCI
jgi:hypothetical protein